MRVERLYPSIPAGIDRDYGSARRSATTEDGVELDSDANQKRRHHEHHQQRDEELPQDTKAHEHESSRENTLDIVA